MNDTSCIRDSGEVSWCIPGQENTPMIRVPQILARLPRLNELAEGLGRELEILKANEHPLNAEELAIYRHGLLDAIEGLVKGQGVLKEVLGRIYKEERLRAVRPQRPQ
jgi:hypothetical protein